MCGVVGRWSGRGRTPKCRHCLPQGSVALTQWRERQNVGKETGEGPAENEAQC